MMITMTNLIFNVDKDMVSFYVDHSDKNDTSETSSLMEMIMIETRKYVFF